MQQILLYVHRLLERWMTKQRLERQNEETSSQLELLKTIISLKPFERKPRTSLRQILEFKKSFLWKDIETLLQNRLMLNYQDLIEPSLGFEALKLLQGSSRELHVLLALPEMLEDSA